MEDPLAARYWCHMCAQVVNPDVFEVEPKCPLCDSGFVEEMGGSGFEGNSRDADSEFGSDRALSLWAPILLGMMGNPRRRRRNRRMRFEDADDDDEEEEDENENEYGRYRRFGERDTELDREIESIIRRRRNSATILQLLQNIRAGMASEYETGDRDRDRARDRDDYGDRESDTDADRGDDREREREREAVIMINPFSQTIVIRAGGSSNESGRNSNTIGSLGDYFVGPGLEMLLQHLAENDPNRYGTPPAQKEAVQALPAVTVEENLQCSVCLDDFEIGSEAKEMPCKHKFHSGCILPWLELHSSCPVCRFQLPADESKLDPGGSSSGSNWGDREREREREMEREMVMMRERDIDREMTWERAIERDRERDIEREIERERERARDRARERERERERERQREREREMMRDQETEGGHGSSDEGDGEENNRSGRRYSIRWPFHGFFSSSSQSTDGNSTASSSSSSTGNHQERTSQADEN